MSELTIGKLARSAGVGVETVRFYERRGLIEQPPKPFNGGFRVYPDEAAAKIRFIRHAQTLGFSLTEIGELLELRADPDVDCSGVRARAQVKLDEVNRKIVRLEEMRRALETLIASCPGQGALRKCTIMEALGGSHDRVTGKESGR